MYYQNFVWSERLAVPCSYYSYKKEVKFHSVNKKPDQECNKHTFLGSEIFSSSLTWHQEYCSSVCSKHKHKN